MTFQQTIIDQLTDLCQRQQATIRDYEARLYRIKDAAKDELYRIEIDGGMTVFPETIIMLAEGKA